MVEIAIKRKASILIDKGRYADALTLLERFLADDASEDADAWCLVGKARGRLGESARSLSAYRRSVALCPGDPENLSSLAWGTLYHGEFDDAVAAFGELAACPTVGRLSGYWRIGLGLCLARRGDGEGALEELYQAARKTPAHTRRAWNEACRIDPEHPVTRRLQTLLTMYECSTKGEYAAAAELLEALLADAPSDDCIWSRLGLAREGLFQPEPALAAYREAAALAPDNPERLLDLARGVCRHASPADALELYERIGRHPGVAGLDSWWFVDRGMAEYAAGRHGEALRSYLLAARGLSVYTSEEGLGLLLRHAVLVEWDDPATREIRDMVKASGVSGETLFSSVLAMPVVFMSGEEERRCIRNLDGALTWLRHRNDVTVTNPLALSHVYLLGQLIYKVEATPFRARITRAILSHADAAPVSSMRAISAPGGVGGGSRLRLGIVFVRASDADRVNVEGFLPFFRHIDRDAFEIILFYPDRHKGIESPGISPCLRDAVDRAVEYPTRNWEEFQRTFFREDLDILLHENWGPALFCGYFRCAPLQCNFHDPQESMGCPHDDYCIRAHDSDDVEYILVNTPEKVAIVSDVYNWGLRESKGDAVVKRGEFGIPESAPLLFSWHNIALWRYEDDCLLETLLRRNPGAWAVFVNTSGEAAVKVMRRWTMRMPEEAKRLVILPFQPYDRLLGLIRLADVVLVPPIASGTLSVGTAFGQGTHYPYFRNGKKGNDAASIAYRKLGIDSLVKDDVESYIATIEFLLTNPDWRKAGEAQLRERLPRLFDLASGTGELQNFLQAAHERRVKGMEPAHWYKGRFIEEPFQK